jgi:hypothetical protein
MENFSSAGSQGSKTVETSSPSIRWIGNPNYDPPFSNSWPFALAIPRRRFWCFAFPRIHPLKNTEQLLPK